MLQVYRPSNRVPATGVLFLLLAVVCGGLAFGGLAFLISRMFWLIVIFPIVLGIAAGAIMSGMVTRQRVRSPALAVVFGLLMGLVIYGTIKYGGYLVFQSSLRETAVKQGIVDAAAQNTLIDRIFTAQTGSTGFFGYLKLMAQGGVSIGRVSSSNRATLPEPVTWGYWLVEFAIIGGIAAMAGRAAAKQPFCESCQQWYGADTHLGSVPEASKEQLLSAAQSGNFRQVGSLIAQQSIGSPSIELYIERCQREHDHRSVF